MFTLAYNSNGLRSQPFEKAVSMVAEAGFKGIELSLQKSHFDHISASEDVLKDVSAVLREYDIRPVCIATGDKSLLSDKDYEPSLINPDPEARHERIHLLKRAICIAHELRAPVVNFASGFKCEDTENEEAYSMLMSGIEELLYDAGTDMLLAIEPEPGMFIETTFQARKLVLDIGNPGLMINMDLGHVECCESDVLDSVYKTLPMTAHIHIEDIKNKVHHHEIPGDGDMDLKNILKIIKESGYSRAVSVELYDHDDVAEEAVNMSFQYLNKILGKI